VAAAAFALAGALSAPTGAESATTGAQLLGVCAPAAGPPTPACYAYVHAIIDDLNLVGPDLDKRIVSALGLACVPSDAPMSDIVPAVVRTLRADPSLQSHSAPIGVRLALTKLYPCTAALLRGNGPAH
jgi:hypothetical protein